MHRKSVIIVLLALAAAAVFLLVANAGSTPQRDSAQSSDLALATFAGGCFWCVEADFDKVPGVEETISGYMGGHVVDPDYAQVSRGDSGHREVVQVRYDPARITYGGLLAAFWRMIDPTDVDGQFVDRGPQYTSAIYYHDEAQRAAAERSLQALSDSGRYDGTLVTPILPAETFYRAEEYHQNFYQRSAIRYRFYRHRSGRDQYLEATWGDDLEVDFSRFAPAAQGNTRRWHRPPDDELRARLTPLQYRVTQRDATEPAYENPYWDNRRPGIYVDIVSGEPLFSSLDQYDSGTGWPSFTRPLEADHIVTRRDFRLLIPRTEVRSRHGDSHLGHVFRDGPQPTGLRYCINSAAMRFVPLERLAEEGYGDYLDLFSDG